MVMEKKKGNPGREHGSVRFLILIDGGVIFMYVHGRESLSIDTRAVTEERHTWGRQLWLRCLQLHAYGGAF